MTLSLCNNVTSLYFEFNIVVINVGCVEVCIELVSLYFLHDLNGNDTFLNEGLLG
jgi:hypothetical protein